jgi:site-specific DNA-methyltransferase (adenine-specific)
MDHCPPSTLTSENSPLGSDSMRRLVLPGVELYCGDCVEIMPLLSHVQAVVSDPPYGIDYSPKYGRRKMPDGTWLEPKEMPAIIGDDQDFDPAHMLDFPIVALWGANHYAHRLPHNGKWLVWDKRCQVIPPRNQADCEMAWINKYGAARILYHMWDGMVRDSERDTPRVHPTQKPVMVMGWMMDQAKVPEGAVVCDPYMGSGTTGIACIRTGRKFVGIEKDPEHFKTACERIKRELAQGDLFLGQNAGSDAPGATEPK